MRTFVALVFLFPGFFLAAQQALPPIGLWRDHLPYTSLIDIAGGNKMIYGATPFSVFAVNTDDKSIERMSRTTGLSETGVSTIFYDHVNEKLVIVYTNSNIDIIYRNDIFNIADIKRSAIAGDKSIYAIYASGKDYYLSTGIGIIVIDGEKYQVKESWWIGNGGEKVQVNGITRDNRFFYAATAEGLKRAPTGLTNLADYNNWQLVSGTGGLSAGSYQGVFNIQEKIIVQKNDSLFLFMDPGWDLLYYDGFPIVSTTVSENKLVLSQRKINGEAKVTVLDSDGSVVISFVQASLISNPRKAIWFEGDTWIADEMNGLLQFGAPGSFERYIPGSPASLALGEMAVENNVFYAAAGAVDENWNKQNNRNGIYIFKEGNWINLNHKQYPSLDSVPDIISLAVDPKDASLWAGSFEGGLLHVKAGPQFEIFKQGNLSPHMAEPSSYRIAGIAFDRENNLWIANYGAVEPLVVKKANGNFQKLSSPLIIPENAFTQILIDDNNYKWIVAAKTGGLVVYDHGLSIENTSDDRWKKLNTGSGNGNLPAADVTCIAKDRNGFIWVGTSNGIGVIQCPQELFTNTGCEAIWPVVQQGNFAGYLFKGEYIRSIAIDGADRKWIATKKGAWLVSSTGEDMVYQFTEENSPLLSNDVKRITMDDRTGEVYFATAKGICSFRSTATVGTEKNEDVLVFPNPVPPGYSGSIGIRGLVNNAIVKITGLDGRLVYQARALGGQVVWDGRDYKGRKIATGVYMVLVSNDERTEKTAAKIVFINK